MKHKPGFIVILLTFFVQISFAQEKYAAVKDPVLFRQKFSVASQKITTIEAGFIQEKNLSILSEKIISHGKFLFRKENKLRWEYSTPFRYLIILNNGKIFIQDEERKTKIDIRSNKLFAEINEIIIGSVQGNLFNDEKKFTASFFESKRNYLVTLKPLTSKLKEFLSEIRLYLDTADFSVIRLEMHESSGDFTGIDFTGKKMNLPIPDEQFRTP